MLKLKRISIGSSLGYKLGNNHGNPFTLFFKFTFFLNFKDWEDMNHVEFLQDRKGKPQF